MSSPFSKKNLPFIIFAVVAIALVLVLVFKPFQSSFGDAPVQYSNSFGTATLSGSQMLGRIQDANPFGSLSVTDATADLDKVIEKAKNIDPSFAGVKDPSGELGRLYSQIRQTLPVIMNYRDNISANTSANEVLTKMNMLAYPIDLLIARQRELGTPK